MLKQCGTLVTEWARETERVGTVADRKLLLLNNNSYK